MLDAFIIDEKRRREWEEEERCRESNRPAIEIPLWPEAPHHHPEVEEEEEKPERGVIVIDLVG